MKKRCTDGEQDVLQLITATVWDPNCTSGGMFHLLNNVNRKSRVKAVTWSNGRLMISLIGCSRLDPVQADMVSVAMIQCGFSLLCFCYGRERSTNPLRVVVPPPPPPPSPPSPLLPRFRITDATYCPQSALHLVMADKTVTLLLCSAMFTCPGFIYGK